MSKYLNTQIKEEWMWHFQQRCYDSREGGRVGNRVCLINIKATGLENKCNLSGQLSWEVSLIVLFLFVNICSEVWWCLWQQCLSTWVEENKSHKPIYAAVIILRQDPGIKRHVHMYSVPRERDWEITSVVIYFCSQDYIQILLSNITKFSRENQFCDLDSNKESSPCISPMYTS